jgi:mono/diheme cytochrome c family protein
MSTRALRAWSLALACIAAPAASATAQAPGQPGDDGIAIYRRACATCHGIDGRGPDRAHVTFEEAVPDFTDCNFTSREPVQDWVTIAHQGGRVRAFSRMMPAFGGALRYDELERAVRYIKSFCSDKRWPGGELNLPRPLVTEKAFPEDEWVLENDGRAGSSPSIAHNLVYERRIGRSTQVEVAIPYRYERIGPVAGAHRWVSGIGDVARGLKQVLSHSVERGPIISASARVESPDGQRSGGPRGRRKHT